MIIEVRLQDDKRSRIDALTDQKLIETIGYYTNEIILVRSELVARNRSGLLHPFDIVLTLFNPEIEEGNGGWRNLFSDEVTGNSLTSAVCLLDILQALAVEALVRDLAVKWVATCLQRAYNRNTLPRVAQHDDSFVQIPEGYRYA